MMEKTRRFSPNRALLYALLVLVAMTTLFPLYWMVSGSFMRPVELFSRTPHLLPMSPELTAYRRIFELVPLPRYFFNSLLVSLSTTVIAVLISSAAGYCFAQLDFLGKGFWFALTLATLMVQYHARIIPLFTMFTNYNLNNTYLGIILPGMVSALGIFLMTQFFKTRPR